MRRKRHGVAETSQEPDRGDADLGKENIAEASDHQRDFQAHPRMFEADESFAYGTLATLRGLSKSAILSDFSFCDDEGTFPSSTAK